MGAPDLPWIHTGWAGSIDFLIIGADRARTPRISLDRFGSVSTPDFIENTLVMPGHVQDIIGIHISNSDKCIDTVRVVQSPA